MARSVSDSADLTNPSRIRDRNGRRVILRSAWEEGDRKNRRMVFSRSLDKRMMSLRGQCFSARSNLQKVGFAHSVEGCFAKGRLAVTFPAL